MTPAAIRQLAFVTFGAILIIIVFGVIAGAILYAVGETIDTVADYRAQP